MQLFFPNNLPQATPIAILRKKKIKFFADQVHRKQVTAEQFTTINLPQKLYRNHYTTNNLPEKYKKT
jgi:hypothetical protein